MLIALLLILFIIYLAAIFNRRQNVFNKPVTKIIRVIHFFLLVLVIVLVFLSKENIFLRGYWTTKIIFWVFLFSGMLLFPFGYKPTQKKIERIYYRLLFYSPLALIPLLLVPFIGAGIWVLIYNSLIGRESDIKYADNKYRIEQAPMRFMGPDPPARLFVKKDWIEYEEKLVADGFLGKIDSIKITELTADTIYVRFFHSGNYSLKSPLDVVVPVKHH